MAVIEPDGISGTTEGLAPRVSTAGAGWTLQTENVIFCGIETVWLSASWLCNLDNASASLFTFPDLYLISKSKFANSDNQRWPVASSFAVDKTMGCCLCVQWIDDSRGNPWTFLWWPTSETKTLTYELGTCILTLTTLCWYWQKPCFVHPGSDKELLLIHLKMRQYEAQRVRSSLHNQYQEH